MRRMRVMFAFRNLVERHTDELARIVASEHGKVVDDAKGEVIRGMEVAEYACGLPQISKGEYSDQVSTDVDSFSFRQPLGVCAGITPFNFPVMVPMWMHPMAIATGNTFVLKPSERDPSASNFIAELYAEAGPARRRLQRRPRRQGGRRRDPRPPGDRRGLLRRLDADRELRPPARERERQARAGARRRQEPRRGDARRRPRLRRRPPHRRGLRLGRPALHGDRRRRRRRRRGRAADGAAEAQGRGDQGRPGPRARVRHGPGRHAAGARAHRRLHRRRRGAGRRRRRRRARRSRSRATASSSARRCSTACSRRWTSTATRSSAPSSASCASTRWPRRSR